MRYYLVITVYGNSRFYNMNYWDAVEYCEKIKKGDRKYINIQYYDFVSGRNLETNINIDDINEFYCHPHNSRLDSNGVDLDMRMPEPIPESYYSEEIDEEIEEEIEIREERSKLNLDLYNLTFRIKKNQVLDLIFFMPVLFQVF